MGNNINKNYVVDSAKEYIFCNYNKDVTLNEIAKSCYCNSSYLSHVLKEKTGMNISDYIANFRITRAKYYLSTTDYLVTKISELVGYNDSGYFSRIFKRMTYVFPNSFRKNNGR